MKWFENLERKYSRYAISNLMYYITGIYIIGFIIALFAPTFYDRYLSLNVSMILRGQVWRIFTFIVQAPADGGILFAALALYFYYWIGSCLERIWGSFRFNIYFFTGMLLQVAAAFIIYFVFGQNFSLTTHYINLALFMAFAVEYPNQEVMLFFVIPIKIKWLAWLDGIIFVLTIVGGYAASFIYSFMSMSTIMNLAASGIVFSPVLATSALVSMINFIFFAILYKKGPAKTQTQRDFRKAYKTAKKAEKKRNAQMEKERRQSFNERFYNANSEKSTWESANKPYIRRGVSTKHRCAVCGRTELDDENLTFRFCSKCEGNLEYCQEHLYTHIHVTNTPKK